MFSQKTDWHIGDLIPSLIIIIHATFKPNQERGNYKKLVEVLIQTLKERFNFELTSKVYLLAAILNTSKLDLWFGQDFGLSYRQKALDCFTEAVLFIN
ncbi:hypothetical protein BpHYR1_040743 [Brachionus plicatilis]|uniref:Uncharacterized protein n=1 Tax=Brachionus plicatilis TaxID=10195 RepID=A0A3M7PZR8_BRAPC|nr:hypothetical protein BpHYR1_040743 [Brachionus plicatilis]